MRLSKKAQYGTRVMLQLAMSYGMGSVSLNRISKDQGISLKYLEQIMAPLKRAGLVKGRRGAGGGYLLKKNPSNISLIEIIKPLEGRLSITDCVDDKSRCERSSRCGTRDTWVYLNSLICNALNSVRLQDLVDQSKRKKNEEKGRISTRSTLANCSK